MTQPAHSPKPPDLPSRSSEARSSPRATPAILAATFLVLSIAGFVLLEISLRLSPLVLPQPWRSVVREAARIPLSNVRTFAGRSGGVAIALPKNQRADILVVGDSFAFGTYVAGESTYARQLERKLGVSVVNLGVSAQSPPTYNRMLEVGSRYHPKRILYAVFGNDFLYASAPEVKTLSVERGAMKEPSDSGLFTEKRTWEQRGVSALRALTNLSLGYQLFKRFQMKVETPQPIPWTSPHGAFYLLVPKSYWDGQLSLGSAGVRAAVESNTALIGEAERFARSLRAELTVLLQPTKEMVFGPLAGKTGEAFYSDAHHATYRRLTENLQKKGISVWDATDYLRARAAQGAVLYHSLDGHFDESGHAEIAEWIARRLKKKD